MSDPPALHVSARGEGPIVVLAHGFGGSARNFRALQRALSDRWRVVAFDLRGHARSEAPPGAEAYTLGALADDVGRVLDLEGAQSAVVGGLSLGAAAALAFAARSPERVRALLLASYPAPRGAVGRSGFGRSASEFADAIEREGLERAGERFVWGPASGLDPRSAAFVRQGFLEHPPHALAHLLRAVLAVLPEPEEVAGPLAGRGMPTLLVAGGEDRGALASHEALARALPGARRVVLAGAGHVVNLAAPAAFESAVREFLDSL